MIVGYTFDQRRPDAMMTCRMGYCHGFELLGIPYIIVDIHEVEKVLPKLANPFCMLYAADLIGVNNSIIKFLKDYHTGIWVQPWFKDSKNFFIKNGLDYKMWTFDDKLIQKILRLEADFGFTATVSSGLNYFNEWEQNNLKIASLPLACDTTIYSDKNQDSIFSNIELAFVGGYWPSKGLQIDAYLKPWENHLTIYGYSKWPYKGYKGLLDVKYEPVLYKKARVCPVINEPTVALMEGQINERVFKVLGSGGCPVVDAVPAYRELYTDNEILIAQDREHFNELIKNLLSNNELNMDYRDRGFKATISRHTYRHRAMEFLKLCSGEKFIKI
jgi:spore maturation protein CgeB